MLREFVRTPRAVGAVAPCSPALAREMVSAIDWPRVRTVVELGPGTGTISSHVIASAPAGCRVILIERNRRLVDVLRERHPTADVVCGNAERARDHCRELGVTTADVILAGLPWASLPEGAQEPCLHEVRRLLDSDGDFATYAQLQGRAFPAGRKFYRDLCTGFTEVRLSPVVWRSVPPSLVYHCRGPVPEDEDGAPAR